MVSRQKGDHKMQTYMTVVDVAHAIDQGAALRITDRETRPGVLLLKIEEMRDGGAALEVAISPNQAEVISAVLGTLASQARSR